MYHKIFRNCDFKFILNMFIFNVPQFHITYKLTKYVAHLSKVINLLFADLQINRMAAVKKSLTKHIY